MNIITEKFNALASNIRSYLGYKPKLGVVAVGSLTLDRKSIVDEIPYDEKVGAIERKTRLGGGGINFHKALTGIADLYGVPLNGSIITRVGKARPAAKRGTKKGDLSDAALDKRNHQLVDDLLKINNIKIIDLAQGQYHFIPDNAVIEHKKGRGIATYFEKSATQLKPSTLRKTNRIVKKANLLFVHSRYVADAQPAIKKAKEAGVPILIDYSVTKQPDSSVVIKMNEDLVRDADYIVAPAEAVLSSQGYKKSDGQTLLNGFVTDYGAKKVAVSDNSDPVLVHDGAAKNSVLVEKVEAPKLLGIGDTRNAALAFALSLGAQWEKAIRIATKVASLKATETGLRFLDTMKPEDVPELYELVNGSYPKKENHAEPVF